MFLAYLAVETSERNRPDLFAFSLLPFLMLSGWPLLLNPAGFVPSTIVMEVLIICGVAAQYIYLITVIVMQLSCTQKHTALPPLLCAMFTNLVVCVHSCSFC